MKKTISQRDYIIIVTILIYPFFPIIKEWNSILGLILELIILAGLCIKAFLRRNSNQIRLHTKKVVVYFITFLLFYLMLNIKNTYAAFSGFRAILMYLLLYEVLMKENSNKKDNIKISAKTNASVAYIMSIGCIVQFIMPDIIKNLHNPAVWSELRWKTSWQAFGVNNRAISFMTDPNVLGVFLAFSLLGVYLLYKNTQIKSYIWGMSIMFISIILTQSRTAIFLILIYGVASLLRDFLKRGTIKLSKMILIIVASVVMGSLFFLYRDTILGYIRIETLLDGNGRLDKNNIHLLNLFNNPISLLFGNGLFDGRAIIFENVYLLVIYMFGCVGTVFFILLISQYFKEIIVIENLEIIICYLAACFVGDYILIPQITMVVLICLSMNIKN